MSAVRETLVDRDWRRADRERDGIRAAAISRAIETLTDLDGMFRERREYREAIAATIDLLATEKANLEHRADGH